jgi:TRAP-type C4-dicarboxylate transport system permease small subunit
MIDTLDRILAGIEVLYTRTSQAVLAALVLGLLGQVVYRYAFGRSFLGLDELTKLALVWLTFLMAAVLHRKRKHITVNALFDILSPRLQSLAGIVVSLATVVLAIYLFVQMGAVWKFFGLVSPVFEIPDTAYRVAPLFAFIPILLQELVNIARPARNGSSDVVAAGDPT